MSSALRPFKALTNVAPVSPSVPIDVGSVNTLALKFPCNLIGLDGTAAAAGYLQIFDLAVAPTTGVTVPLMSMKFDNGSSGVQPMPSYWPFEGPLKLQNGLYIAVSSTEAVYTAVATNFDVWGVIEEFEGYLQPALTAVGDLTTQVTHLQVWAEAAGPKKLVRVIITPVNMNDTGYYMMLFAKDAPTDLTEIPLQQWYMAPETAYVYDFGKDGLDVESQDDDYTRRKGCTLWISSTTGLLTKLANSDRVALKAYYKT